MEDPEEINKQVRETGEIVEDALRSIASNIGDIFSQALDSTSDYSKTLTKDITAGINAMARGTDKLVANEIALAEGKGKADNIEKQLNDRLIKRTAIQKRIMLANRNGLITDEERVKAIAELNLAEQDITAELEKQLATQRRIDEKMGGMGNIVKGMGKIPFVGQFLETDKALQSMAKAAGKGATKAGVMGAGLKSMGASLAKAGPQILLMEVVKAIGRVDAELVEMSKGLNMSKKEAGNLRMELQSAATQSNDLFITTTKLIEAQNKLNKAFGTAAVFSGEILVQSTKLLEKVKLAGEAVAGLAGQSIVAGDSFEDNYETSLLTSYEMQRQTGISVDLRNVMTQVGAVSGALRASLGGSTEAITRAVTQAELLGMNMKDIASSAKALLDFESSIEAELQAELLTGKQLNLERARLAALTNDQETLQRELNKNIGSFTEFGAMNVLQQDALAKSMGMTSDQLGDILFKQEIQGKTARELRALGKDELADRLEATTAQDKFNAMMTKLQGIIADIVTPLIPLLDAIMSIINPILALLTFLDPITRAIQTIVTGLVDTVGFLFGGDFSATRTAAKQTGDAFKNSGKMIGLSEGGIVTKPTMAMIGEGGESEAVIPLSKLKESGFGGSDLAKGEKFDYDRISSVVSETIKPEKFANDSDKISDMIKSKSIENSISPITPQPIISPIASQPINNITLEKTSEKFDYNKIAGVMSSGITQPEKIDYNKMASAMSKVQISTSTRYDSFAAKSQAANHGSYQRDARHQTRFA